jgi:ankyrin repeat protein
MLTESDIENFSDAVVYGDFDLVKEMIKNTPEIINSQDKWGFTALHNVMSEEQFEIIRYLVSNDVKVNIQNEVGIAPLHLACYKENAKLLFDAGADINLKDKNGNTPLHILAADGEERIEVIEYLISIGANKEIKNNSMETPLDISNSRKDFDMVRVLNKKN